MYVQLYNVDLSAEHSTVLTYIALYMYAHTAARSPTPTEAPTVAVHSGVSVHSDRTDERSFSSPSCCSSCLALWRSDERPC